MCSNVLVQSYTSCFHCLVACSSCFNLGAQIETVWFLQTARLQQHQCMKTRAAVLLLFRRDAFTMNMLEIPQGAGSGFIWDDKGVLRPNAFPFGRLQCPSQ